MKLCDKIENLKPYEPIKGNFKIRLDANESCYNLEQPIIDKIKTELGRLDFNRYPDSTAGDVCAAFADYYYINPEYVTAGNGSDELISVITSCFLEKGDAIVTLSDDFSMYRFYSGLYELDVKTFPKNDDFTVDIDRLIQFCKDCNCKTLIFSNPCNPTSLGIKKAEVLKLLESLDCFVIVDEAYMDFWGQSVLDCLEKYANLVVLKTCSKFLGLAAVRLGFAASGTTVTNALRAVKSPYNTDTVSQLIGGIVYREREYLEKRKESLIANTRLLYNELQKFDLLFDKIYETRANFCFSKTAKANEIYDYLLKNSIAVRKFFIDASNTENTLATPQNSRSGGYLRITAGTENEIKCLIKALTAFK